MRKFETKENKLKKRIDEINQPFVDQATICEAQTNQMKMKAKNGGKFTKEEVAGYLFNLQLMGSIAKETRATAMKEGLLEDKEIAEPESKIINCIFETEKIDHQ